MALKHRHAPKGLLHHSDRGVQYARQEGGSLLLAAGMMASMSAKGNPCDNATMASCNAAYQREYVGPAEAAAGNATRA